MHDFQKVTAIALPQILGHAAEERLQGRAHGAEGHVDTLPEYDEAVLKENKLPMMTNRPTNSVVRTISGE